MTDEVFLYKDRVPQVLHEVRDATDGAGVDVVYDGVGLDTHLLSLNCVKVRCMTSVTHVCAAPTYQPHTNPS